MPNIHQFYDTLRAKLQPSVDIQRMGSMNRAIRSSSTFGPQINTGTFNRFQHSQNPMIQKLLNKMNQ